jgi:hypothetical protein
MTANNVRRSDLMVKANVFGIEKPRLFFFFSGNTPGHPCRRIIDIFLTREGRCIRSFAVFRRASGGGVTIDRRGSGLSIVRDGCGETS